MNPIIYYLGSYLVLLFIILAIFGKSKSEEDFLIAGRTRPWWQIALSKFAAVVGVATLVTYTGLAYEYGIGTFAVTFGLIGGILLFSFWGIPQIKKLSQGAILYTISDLIELRLKSKKSRIITDLVMVFILALFLLIAIIGGGHIIAYFDILSYELAVTICGLVVMAYVIASGFKALIITDIFQSIIIAVLTLLMFLFIGQNVDVIPAIQQASHSLPLAETVGFLIFGIFSFFALGDRYQLVFSSNTPRDARRGMVWSIVPIIGIIALLFIIGMVFSGIQPGLEPSTVLLKSLTALLPQSIIPIIVVLFMAGLMSTADTQIFTLAAHLSFLTENNNNTGQVKKIRIITVITFGLTILAALLFRDIVDLSILAGALMVGLAIPIMYVLSGRSNNSKYLSSLIVGILLIIIGSVIHGFSPHLIVYGCIGSVLGLVLAGPIQSILQRKSHPAMKYEG